MARLLIAALMLATMLACVIAASNVPQVQRLDDNLDPRSPLILFQVPTAAILGQPPISSAVGATRFLRARIDSTCSLAAGRSSENFCFGADSGSYCPSCGTCCSAQDTDTEEAEGLLTSRDGEKLLRSTSETLEWCCGTDAVCCAGGKCCPSGGVCCAEGCCEQGQQCIAGKCIAGTGLPLSTSSTARTAASVKPTASDVRAMSEAVSTETRPTATTEEILIVAEISTSPTPTSAYASNHKAISAESAPTASVTPVTTINLLPESTPTPTASTTGAVSHTSGLPFGAAVGLIISSAAVFVVLGFIIALYCRRRRNDRARARAAQMSMVLSPSSPLLHDSPTMQPVAFGGSMRSRSPLGLSYTAYPPYAIYNGNKIRNENRSGDDRLVADHMNETASHGIAGRISRTGSAAATGILAGIRSASRSGSRRSFRPLVDADDTSTINLDDEDAAEAHFAKLLQEVREPLAYTLPRSRSAAPSSVYSAYPSSAAFPPAAYAVSHQVAAATGGDNCAVGGGGYALPIAASMMAGGRTASQSANTNTNTNMNISAGPTNLTRAPSFAASAVAMARNASTGSTSSTMRSRTRSIFFPAPHHDAPFSPPPSAPAPSRPLSSVMGGVGIALSCDEPLYSPLPKTSPMSLAMSVSSVSSAGTGLGPAVLRWSQGTGRWSEASAPQTQQAQTNAHAYTQGHGQGQNIQNQNPDSGVAWSSPSWTRKPYVQIGQNAWSYAPTTHYDKDLLVTSPSSSSVTGSGHASPLISPRTRAVTPVLGPGTGPGFIAELEGSGPLI
ncbi:hypothetical protein HOO65_060564 [Ceratocystis lukuohia]|uniref:Uncharacterized protein n=1 Tax=Ceratocystis lukuohia TaxID=2019550 RepID=A0ABR4MEN6_9PEZI